MTDATLMYHRPDAAPRVVRWDDLRAVLIETTDQGPCVEDTWWIMVDSDR